METVIKVEELSKCYRVGVRDNLSDTFTGEIFNFIKSPYRNYLKLRKLSDFSDNGSNSEDIIWALRDISFEVKKGEILGIIGKNGAGKSTLLKILSRISEPSEGRAVITGKVSSLLEVGTGFHPELTGRENIYLNGTILGMTKSEIDRKFDEIVAFSEIEKFLDTPVKRYSSGMGVRLAFAIAAHLDPDIMIIDEVLAVGDFRFQDKCLKKIDSIRDAENRTVIFVSHNLNAVLRLCHRVIVLNNGEIIFDGDIKQGIHYYMNYDNGESNNEIRIHRENIPSNGEYRIVDLELLNNNNDPVIRISSGDYLKLRIHIELLNALKNLGIDVHIYAENQIELSKISSYPVSGYKIGPQGPGKFFIDFIINSFPFVDGDYSWSIDLVEPNVKIFHKLDHVISIKVNPGDFYNSGYPPDTGFVAFDHKWDFKKL